MIEFRPLPILTAIALAALVILSLFGRWQWDKYLIERAAPPPSLQETTLQNYEVLENPYFLVYGIASGEPGWRLLVAVRTPAGVRFVDGAFSPGVEPPARERLKVPPALQYGEPLQGVLGLAEPPGSMVAEPDTEARVWYALDLESMARAAGLERSALTDTFVAIPYVGADGRPQVNPFAAPPVDTTPPGQHLGYAMTWWGLAIALVCVYFGFHVSSGRLRLRRQGGAA